MLERGFTQAALVTEDGEVLADAGVFIPEGQEPAGFCCALYRSGSEVAVVAHFEHMDDLAAGGIFASHRGLHSSTIVSIPVARRSASSRSTSRCPSSRFAMSSDRSLAAFSSMVTF